MMIIYEIMPFSTFGAGKEMCQASEREDLINFPKVFRPATDKDSG
jgi:hypothetical protein